MEDTTSPGWFVGLRDNRNNVVPSSDSLQGRNGKLRGSEEDDVQSLPS
jgi:hypothetical protein